MEINQTIINLKAITHKLSEVVDLRRTALGDAWKKLWWKLREGALSGGTLRRSPLLENEKAVDAMDNPWDDGELASPRRGEPTRIGELYSFFKPLIISPPVETHIYVLGVVRIV